MVKELAEAILLTQFIREASFDHKMANNNKKIPYFDFENCYKVHLYLAVEKALIELNMDIELVEIVYLLCKLSWNESQDWAKKYVEEK